MSDRYSKETKHKLTPYNKFVKKMFAELKKEHPNDTAPQIMKRICDEWQKIRTSQTRSRI